MFRLLTLSLAAALVSLSSPAHAQVRTAFPAERGLSIADFPRLVPVGEGVYAYEAPRKPGFTTVSMIVVGSDGVLIAEIGRASCRERVCQYVYISVVAVSLKKKSTKN